MASETVVDDVFDREAPDEDAPVPAARPNRLRLILTHPWFWLGVVIVVGSALRFVGLDWGLPLRLHPDEFVVVDGAIDMAKRNSFEPHYFMRPDHLEIKINYLSYELYSHLLHGTTPEALFARDQAPFYLIARMNTAIMGVLAIPVAYLIGRRLPKQQGSRARWVGVLAAAIFAFYPLYVEHAHYATPDVPLVLTSLLVVLFCVHYIQSPRWGWVFAACFAVALGFIAKYPAALGGAVVGASIVAAGIRDRAWRRTVLQAIAAPVIFVGSVFVLSPVLFTDIDTVREQVENESRSNHLGHDGLGVLGNFEFYVRNGLTAMGIILAVFAVLGAVRLIRDRALHAIPLLVGVVMLLGMSALPLHWVRWGLPMHITALLLAPVGAFALYDWLSGWPRTTRYARWIVGALVAVALTNLLVTSTARVSDLLVPDTRSVGLDYFEENGITKENTIFEGYSPLSPGSPKTVFKNFEFDDDGTLKLRPTSTSKGDEYVVLSNGMGSRFRAQPSKYPDEIAMYDAIADQFEVVERWSREGTSPPVTAVELVNIPRQIPPITSTIRGERTSGPSFTLYRIPDSAR